MLKAQYTPTGFKLNTIQFLFSDTPAPHFKQQLITVVAVMITLMFIEYRSLLQMSTLHPTLLDNSTGSNLGHHPY
jgi:hypothetical protein